MRIVLLLMLMDEEHRTIFTKLYEEHVEAMVNAAYKIINNAAIVEDVIMEVFEKLMNNPQSILQVPELKRKYYLITSAKNAAKNIRNRKDWKMMQENEWNAKKEDSGTNDFATEDFIEAGRRAFS